MFLLVDKLTRAFVSEPVFSCFFVFMFIDALTMISCMFLFVDKLTRTYLFFFFFKFFYFTMEKFTGLSQKLKIWIHFPDLLLSTKLDENDAEYLPVVIVAVPRLTNLNLILGCRKNFTADALILSSGQNFVYQDLLPIQHILDKCEKLIVLYKYIFGGRY